MEPWSHTTYTWRVNRRLTQYRAAAIAGVSLTTWSRWERGLTEPDAPLARETIDAMYRFDRRRMLDAG
jgi:transcriptional regulator with XRE-family HTH domain